MIESADLPVFQERYKLIRAKRNQDCTVTLWGVSESGVKWSWTVEHKPYFYVRLEDTVIDDAITDTEFGYTDISGEDLRKVYCDNPSSVPRLRELFPKTWEADIPFARRFLIDRKITSAFDYELNSVPNFPCRILKVYLDIEVEPREKGMPDSSTDRVTCVTLSDGYQTVSLLLDKLALEQNGPTTLMKFKLEKELLEMVFRLLEEWEGVMLIGWNVDFDVQYLLDRAKILDVGTNVLDSYCVFDLLPAYRALYRRRSYRLKDIAVDEGLIEKAEDIDYKQLWDSNKESFLRMNQTHTWWLCQVDSKLKVSDYYWELREAAGTEDMKDMYSSVIIDTMLLRRAAGKWVLPSKQKHEHKRFEGALVISPPNEVVDNVAVFDLARFYPHILLNQKLCPVLLAEYRKSHQQIDWLEYQKFTDGKSSLLLDYVREMIELREKFTREGHKEKLAAIKGLLNSTYGVTGYPGFRLYVPEIPARVTEVARTVISALGKEVQEWGYRLVCGDTDSLFLVCQDDLKQVEHRLNEALKKYGDYTIKLDHFFSRCLFTGSKKRYAGLEKDGKIHVTGFERVRTDASNYTKEIQEKVIRMILEKRNLEIVPYLKSKVDNIRKVPLEDIAISKTLSKNLEEYDGVQQNYLLTAKDEGMELKQGDFVKMLPAKNYPNGIAVFQDLSELKKTPVIDWNAIVEKQIKKKVEDLLPLAGAEWSMVEGQQRLL